MDFTRVPFSRHARDSFRRDLTIYRGPVNPHSFQSFSQDHSVARFHRQGETQLMRQHACLAAMMGIVHDHVGKHGGAAGPRSGPSVALESLHATR